MISSWSPGRRMISPSPPPLPRPSWTEVPSETVPQPTDCFLTFDKSQFFTVFLLPSLLPLDRAHFTSHGLGPLSCLTVSSPRNFSCLVCTRVRHHLLTGWPAPADCGPSQLPAERCCRRCHHTLQSVVQQSEAEGGKPPSGKARSTWTRHPQPLSILLQPNLAGRQIHFATWTITFCILQFVKADFSKAYLFPLSRSLYCSCLNQLGRRSTASMEFGLFSKLPTFLHLLAPPYFFSRVSSQFWSSHPNFQPLPGLPNLWEGSQQPADCDSQRQLKGPNWGRGALSTILPDTFTQLADNAKL